MTDDPRTDDPETNDPNFLTRRLRWGVDPDVEGHADAEIATDAPAEALIDPGDEDWDPPEPDPVPVAALDAAPSFERRDLARRDEEALDRRRQLWRDTAIILSGIVIALLIAQVLLPGAGGTAMASPTPITTGFGAGPTASPDGGPSASSVPLVDPSLGIDATPTPIPVVTLPPTGSAAPTQPNSTPAATPKPTRTPKPTTAPSPVPTLEPTPTPEITPLPKPVAIFDCTPLAGLLLSCSESSTDATSWLWDWGDGTQDSGSNPGPHTYASDLSPVTVTLTVTGPGGTDAASHQYTLVP